MKVHYYIFLFSLLLVNCKNYKEKNLILSNKESSRKKNQYAKQGYEVYKKNCQLLYNCYKNDPSDRNKVSFVSYFADSLLPCWYGTPWDFNGTTEKPGEGSIACGYFVTTTLRDAGIPLQRIKLAQSASQVIIRKLCTKESIHIYSNAPLNQFVDAVSKMGYGLYIVGLDYHTGLLLNDGQQVWFIHSSYIKPAKVVCEKANESIVLNSSHYRIIGKINL